MDDREAKLLQEIDLKRAELVERAEALRRSAAETFDPREKLRRHPLAGILTSMGAGFVLGMLPGRRRAGSEEVAGYSPNPLVAVAAGLLPGVLPALIGPLLSLVGRFGERKPRASADIAGTNGETSEPLRKHST